MRVGWEKSGNSPRDDVLSREDEEIVRIAVVAR
jgi:hypothetical protein